MPKYKCGDCGKVLEDLNMSQNVRCPYCGYRVLFKERDAVATRKIKAV